MTADVVFLLDVDNTLLDNDRFIADFRHRLDTDLGHAAAGRYWSILAALRSQLGYVDYLGALQRYRAEIEDGAPAEQEMELLKISGFLIDYPYEQCLYPRAHAVIEHLDHFGPTVILSDGDVVLQPRKLQRSGLWDAVNGRVLITIHKEQMLDAVLRRYPAHHYVLIDDKLRILAAVKEIWQDRVTTIFPRQGHYALDPAELTDYPEADFTIEHIGDLADTDLAPLLKPSERLNLYQRLNPYRQETL